MTKRKLLQMIKALFFSYVITMVLILLAAFVSYKLELSDLFARVCIILSYIFSCFSGGFLIGRQSEKKQYLWGLFVGVVYFLVILLVSVLINKGVFVKPQSILTVLAMCSFGGMLGGMLS